MQERLQEHSVVPEIPSSLQLLYVEGEMFLIGLALLHVWYYIAKQTLDALQNTAERLALSLIDLQKLIFHLNFLQRWQSMVEKIHRSEIK